ncbi:hypothetical protein RJ639_008461 [Escallonia herrerae]|uniref:Integrase catalytic domain-containing protein n=1 Tax=Escallonia herrerae TaxID=1293975 RepID=A0AA88VVD3_9ASTE|nr:hypothetical protein RJ639_008461 [Escallonia herrerae]
MSNLLDQVEKYIRAEEDSMTTQDEGTSGQKRRNRPEGRLPEEPKRSRATLSKHLTPFTTSREHILNQIKSQNILKWPKPMRMPADKRDAQLYCHTHKDHGHTTEECKVLQREIENLIAKRHLKQFVKANELQGGRRGGSQRRHEESVPKDPPGPVKRPRIANTLSFDDTDLIEIIIPHDDALISRDRIRPVASPLYGFTGASAPVEGVIPLTVVVGKHPLQATQSIDFLVVKVKSAYNGILGRAGLNKLQAVASTFNLCMKFPTPDGIGVVKGDQAVARKCYMASCRVEEALAIEDQRDEHTFRRAEPNIKNFEWTAKCQASFEALKNYLSAPPLPSKPLVGEELFLYFAIADSAVSAVLVREQDGKQLPIYYVSKVLQGAELRYPDTEKLAFAFLVAARKLRPYFQSHSITVLTDKPLRRILHKPNVSGRQVPWSIEPGEFDISYRPRPSIKGQALDDFIVECTLPIEDKEQLPQKERPFTWTLHVDGSSNSSGSGASLILHGPENLIASTKPSVNIKQANTLWDVGDRHPGPFPSRHGSTFGIPRVLITDNGKQFDNSTFRTFCANLSIEQRFTSVAHPQTNGQTEVTNRTLLQGIKKKLDGASGLWVDELPKILWAYNTTSRTSTGETPFSLSFGTEALIPVKIRLPSLRLTMYDPVQNEEALRANLDLLDERRELAAYRQ